MAEKLKNFSDSNGKYLVGKIKELLIDPISGKVTTLIGDDTNKSVRTIANEELVKQLIPESAKESLDTLQEIATWIQQHPDDVAEMNEAIAKNTEAIGKAKDGSIEGTGLTGRMEAVEAKLGGDVADVLSRVTTLEGIVGDSTSGLVKDNVQNKSDISEIQVALNGDGGTNEGLIASVNNLKTNKADKATTLAGYGITDAKIADGTITLGSDTITPLTEHQSLAEYAKTADVAATYETIVNVAKKADKATTLAGYGITDAKIADGVITLGSETITPLTEHQDITGKQDKLTAGDGIAINGTTISVDTVAFTNDEIDAWFA